MCFALGGVHGWFDEGAWLKPLADGLFPESQWAEHGREYWRSLGLILAWPLFFWNVFTASRCGGGWPLASCRPSSSPADHLLLGQGSLLRLDLLVRCLGRNYGRQSPAKMPHGMVWNKVNIVGQVALLLASVLLILRLVGWALPHDHWINGAYMGYLWARVQLGQLPFPLTFLNYVWSVDLLLAGILGVWAVLAFQRPDVVPLRLPLAALMHVYARFSRFRILADRKVHLLQCLHLGVPPRHRHYELRQQGAAHGRPAVRAL